MRSERIQDSDGPHVAHRRYCIVVYVLRHQIRSRCVSVELNGMLREILMQHCGIV